jgi:phosphatidylinositol glycan class K
MIDTCEAASMYERIRSPNILAAASSVTGQSSYSDHSDDEIGVPVVDRFTRRNLETLERVGLGDQKTLQDLVRELFF